MRICPAAALSLVLVPSLARAEIPIRAERVATGLSMPLFVTAAPGDPNRIYILEQRNSGGVNTSAAIRILDLNTGSLNGSNFLTIPNVSTGFEQGALGLAFHPNYASNGLFYVNLTDSGGDTRIRQYSRVNANTASTTFSTLMTIDQPQANHNGGWIGFGPTNGLLYISTGDGGGDNDDDPGHTTGIGNSQDPTNLLGKILRIDVNSDGFPSDAAKNYAIPSGNPYAGSMTNAQEIWIYGLRNPWRASFDRGSAGGGTGNFYIGDVGQNAWEEIDFQPANSAGGENYGWRAREGAHNTGFTPSNPGMVDPIHEYPNSEVGQAVTGGYVYRGSENDALAGTYFFADYQAAKIWSFKYDGTTITKFRELTGEIEFETGQGLGLISSFGEDAQGRLYVTDLSDGEVYRLVPAFPGDADLDNFVDQHDLGLMAIHWQQVGGAGWADGDFTDDGNVDVLDLVVLANHWQLGPDALAAALIDNGLPTDVVPEASVMMLAPLLLLIRRRSLRNPRPVLRERGG